MVPARARHIDRSASDQQQGPAPAGAATLLVRHLPEAITQEMLSRLFSHYGATSVRPCSGGKLRNCAFVDFRDEAAANHAHSLLNRFASLRFLGKVLTVERANCPNANESHLKHQDQLGHGASQVLHLMNKMNLPAPFRMALPTPPLPSQVPVIPHPQPPPGSTTTGELHSADLSSDESELESSDEDIDKRKIKRAKHEAIVGPAVDKNVAHEAVGVKSVALVSNELQVIKKKNPVLQIKITPKPIQKEPPVPSMTENEPDSTHEQLQEKHFVTPQEMSREKLPPEEILSLPMFKNYTPGNPASVLYIKNLAKDVTHDDFYYVFGKDVRELCFRKHGQCKVGFKCKVNAVLLFAATVLIVLFFFHFLILLQEGRMRGQAFVTFPTVELAQRALNLAHGYVFKGKPMIIQFGRNPAANKAS
ncbi:U11/U12 small nuclear ribonucleoprotein 65 kDa protein [Zea mays]|uniref:U11/U12 small nuclear ribonucleoprotein 65 kDa protein n=1 Tax=Zea mays TaxID=4577 RepID=A0A1D6K1A4_MAIZE|nr:U11/U12 small nuclear ribonucleoprotein 65 kDa protein [Zea mays]